MGFNLNTRNTNNLRGSKEIDSIGDDLVNISSSLGGSNKAFAWVKLNDKSTTTSDDLPFGAGSAITATTQSMIVSHSQSGPTSTAGTTIFSTVDGTYRILGSLILEKVFSANTTVNIGIKKDDTDLFYLTSVLVKGEDDPHNHNFTAVTTINSGSFVKILIGPSSNPTSTLNYHEGSVFYVRKIS